MGCRNFKTIYWRNGLGGFRISREYRHWIRLGWEFFRMRLHVAELCFGVKDGSPLTWPNGAGIGNLSCRTRSVMHCMYSTNCLDRGHHAFSDGSQPSLPDAQCLFDARVRFAMLASHEGQRYGAGVDIVPSPETRPAHILQFFLCFVLYPLAGLQNAECRVILWAGKR